MQSCSIGGGASFLHPLEGAASAGAIQILSLAHGLPVSSSKCYMQQSTKPVPPRVPHAGCSPLHPFQATDPATRSGVSAVSLPWLPIQVPTLCHEALHERPEVPGSGHGLSWTTGSCEEGSFPAKCSHREAVAGAFLRVPASRVTAEAAKNTSDGHGHQEQHSHHPHHCRFHGHRTTDSLPLSNRGARSV